MIKGLLRINEAKVCHVGWWSMGHHYGMGVSWGALQFKCHKKKHKKKRNKSNAGGRKKH